MKIVPVQSAIGMVLCHDVTEIIPGQSQGPAFRRGHILREQDVPQLLCMGKEHVYAWDIQTDSGLIHENEAAVRIARAAAGRHIALSTPAEGKVNLAAAVDGLLKIDLEALLRSTPKRSSSAAFTRTKESPKGRCWPGLA